MSVIRRPDVLGRTTRQRVVGVTAAISSASIEVVAVGTWFLLVSESRTPQTAIAGLGVLLIGAIARIRVFDVATDGDRRPIRPKWLVTAVAFAACWVVWLLAAEAFGGPLGAAVAATCLGAVIAAQFYAERRCFGVGPARRAIETAVVPAVVLAVGATTLLASTWLGDWAFLSLPLSLAGRTVVVELGAITLGAVAFGVCSFLAHQYRFRRTLTA